MYDYSVIHTVSVVRNIEMRIKVVCVRVCVSVCVCEFVGVGVFPAHHNFTLVHKSVH